MFTRTLVLKFNALNRFRIRFSNILGHGFTNPKGMADESVSGTSKQYGIGKCHIRLQNLNCNILYTYYQVFLFNFIIVLILMVFLRQSSSVIPKKFMSNIGFENEIEAEQESLFFIVCFELPRERNC